MTASAASEQDRTRPRRRALRLLVRLALGVVLLGVVLLAAFVALAAWRDPAPGFAARRGELARIEEGARKPRGRDWFQKVELTSTSGLRVEMTVLAPPEAGPHPTILLLGGHRTGRDAIDLVPESNGIVVAALAYPFQGNHRVKGLEILPLVPRIQRALADTPPAIQLAADYLLQQDYVDPARLELVGVSLGACVGTAAGALDERFRRVWVIHGAADPARIFAHGLRSRISNGPLRRVTAWLGSTLAYGPYLSAERWLADVAPRPLILVNAEDDTRLPRECIEELHARAPEGTEIIWLPGDHVEPDREDVVRSLLELVVTRVLEGV